MMFDGFVWVVQCIRPYYIVIIEFCVLIGRFNFEKNFKQIFQKKKIQKFFLSFKLIFSIKIVLCNSKLIKIKFRVLIKLFNSKLNLISQLICKIQFDLDFASKLKT